MAVENEENKIDFEKDENFTFSFDIALSPEFELSFTHEDKLTYYHITLDEDTLQDQMNAYLSNYGTYEAVDEPALEDDLLKGTLTELENGEPKENGMVIENAIIMPLYVKDEETRKQLIGAKVGDKIVINPKKPTTTTKRKSHHCCKRPKTRSGKSIRISATKYKRNHTLQKTRNEPSIF